MKKKRFNLVMTEKEYEIIKYRADQLGLSISAYLRMKGLSK